MAKPRLAVIVLLGLVTVVCGPSITAPHATAADGPVRGFAIGPNNSTTEYDRLARMGTNTLYLDVYWEADSPDANDVHPYEGTIASTKLASDFREAAARGMRVVFMPKIWCNGCDNNWRGNLNPSDPHLFMQNYTQKMLLPYATLAQQNGLWLFFLGSELQYLQPFADDWRQAAAQVRQVFTGLVTYQPNWDVTEAVPFWDAMDIVTVSAYFPLTPTPTPSIAELKESWHSAKTPGWWQGQDWFAELQRVANTTGKRVLIGEVGYRSSTTAAAMPWAEYQTQTPDQVTQANAYQALLETFSGQPWWMGVIWWQWRGGDSDAGSTDMSPKGKLAEQLLTKWWADGWRPAPVSNASWAETGSGSPAGAAVLAARTRNVAATRQAPTSSSSTAASTTQPATSQPAAEDPGVVNGDSSAAINGPRSVARLDHAAPRGGLVAIAILALLGAAAGVLNRLRVVVRAPRPRRAAADLAPRGSQ